MSGRTGETEMKCLVGSAASVSDSRLGHVCHGS